MYLDGAVGAMFFWPNLVGNWWGDGDEDNWCVMKATSQWWQQHYLFDAYRSLQKGVPKHTSNPAQ